MPVSARHHRTRPRLSVHARISCAALLVGVTATVGAQTPAPRKMVDRAWVALWHTSGDPDDALFGLPRELVATDDGLYVLDVGTRQLSAFARDARKRWTVGTQGRGPGEFLKPVDLALMPGGEIGVLDPDNGRVSVFTAAGKFRTTTASVAASVATNLCVTSDRRIYFIVGAQNALVMSIDTAGKALSTHEFPWAVQANTPSMIKSATFARGRAGAQCTLATTFGFGMATILGGQPLTTRPFIEKLPLPQIEQKRVGKFTQQTVTAGENAARAAFHWRDTLFVNFAGTSKNPRLLDLYDNNGNYIESWTPPMGAWFAYANGMLYAVINNAESPEIVAFAAASDTARILKELRASRSTSRPQPTVRKRQPGS